MSNVRRPWPSHWRWYYGVDVTWKRWGMGVEVALGYWVPREWSVNGVIGPLMLWFGVEEDDDAEC